MNLTPAPITRQHGQQQLQVQTVTALSKKPVFELTVTASQACEYQCDSLSPLVALVPFPSIFPPQLRPDLHPSSVQTSSGVWAAIYPILSKSSPV